MEPFKNVLWSMFLAMPILFLDLISIWYQSDFFLEDISKWKQNWVQRHNKCVYFFWSSALHFWWILFCKGQKANGGYHTGVWHHAYFNSVTLAVMQRMDHKTAVRWEGIAIGVRDWKGVIKI